MARENRTGAFELPQNPQIEDILKTWGRRLKLSIRTNTVGTVVTFDPALQTAAVRVDMLEVLKVTSGEASASLVAPSPPLVLPRVPVEIAGSAVAYTSYPLPPGTTGILHVMDRGLRTWLASLADVPVDPVQSATHALQDAIFVPGARPQRAVVVPPIAQDATVVEGPLVRVGVGAVSPAAKADLLIQAIDAALAAASGAVVPADGGAASFTAFTTAWNAAKASINATKARVE